MVDSKNASLWIWSN